MCRSAVFFLMVLALPLWVSCRPAELKLSESESQAVNTHVLRIVGWSAPLGEEDRALYQEWLTDFFVSLIQLGGSKVLSDMENCRTVKDYQEVLQRDCATLFERASLKLEFRKFERDPDRY